MYACEKCKVEFCEKCSEEKSLFTVKLISRSIIECHYQCEDAKDGKDCVKIKNQNDYWNNDIMIQEADY
jgi:hypothetical protein